MNFTDYSHFDSNKAIISDKGEETTYLEIKSFSSRISIFLKPKSLLFCVCKNMTGSVLGYVSFIEHSISTVMLDASKPIEVLTSFLEIYNPNYIWMPEALYNASFGEILFSEYGYVLVDHSRCKVDLCDGLALMLTTSGSTGSPKLVKLSSGNLFANAESIAEYLQIDENERPITSLPMFYSYGLSVINSHLIKGATILLTESTVMQKEFWAFAKEQKATSISGVPYTYEMLKRLRLFRMDLPCLKTMTQAGGKLNPDIVKEYIEQAISANKKFIVMYGQTEATARMSYLPFDVALEKYSSMGIAIPGGQFSLIDVNGEVINEANVDGELIYSGPNVSLGYAENRSDLAKGDENHGVLHTGDIAKRDEDGYYYITGRLKRFIKIFGNRVNLDAAEQLVKSITTSCACVGVDDCLTVFVTDEGLEDDIKRMLSYKTGINTIAFKVRRIDAIPKNSSGKVQYAELSKLL